jgi:hypothetical protein
MESFSEKDDISQLYPSIELTTTLLPGFPAIHEVYRKLRDQREMVCGAYALTYLLRAFGIAECNGVPVTVDSVAATAGSALEPHNAERLATVRAAINAGDVPEERAREWYLHDQFDYELATAEEGGTSPKGLKIAATMASEETLAVVPVPATHRDKPQFTPERFSTLINALVSGEIPAQPILNYNLQHTLAPTGLLGHKYNIISILTQWDEPEYFRTYDWDVGHFTTLAGRFALSGANERYLLIRDSYRTFGQNGYHLQPESYIHRGLVRADDERDGGMLLVTSAGERETVQSWLHDRNIITGLWNNGSPYRPQTNPFI